MSLKQHFKISVVFGFFLFFCLISLVLLHIVFWAEAFATVILHVWDVFLTEMLILKAYFGGLCWILNQVGKWRHHPLADWRGIYFLHGGHMRVHSFLCICTLTFQWPKDICDRVIFSYFALLWLNHYMELRDQTLVKFNNHFVIIYNYKCPILQRS